MRTTMTSVCALLAIVASPAQAAWNAAADEANRQRMMESMRASSAASDRRNSDAQFQAGLARQSPGTSSSSSSASGSPYQRPDAPQGGSADSGPQSVVASRSVIVMVKETMPQTIARITTEARGGNAQSQYNLGRLHYAGYGMARDDAQARRWFEAAAKQGHAPAAAQAGYLAMYGRGGPVDMAAARAALRLAATGGDPYGQALYGLMQITEAQEAGRIDAPQPEAVAMLVRAADAGEVRAQSTLGSLVYFYGTSGVEKDPVKAIDYLQRAAAQDDPTALHVLGEQYLARSKFVPNDPAKGWALLRRSADAGYGPAARALGMSMVQGSNGIAKDEAGGIKYVRTAAQTEAAAMVDYASLLVEGAAVAKDLVGAATFARRAADAGNADGRVMLARMLYFGEGVAKDQVAAARYARLAADAGNADGEQLTGAFYQLGHGVTKDLKEAVRWLRKAAAQGHAGATSDLREPELVAAARDM